ncbi:MAG: ATP-dependent zinc metalloprotease FtsH [Muribaculaceae bacterium]|nr:ATP-dependent zinc metalloprotease FtsH [Muribaculaceae bacterium]
MKNFMPSKNNRPNMRRPMFNMYWMYALIIACLLGLYYFQENNQVIKVNWTKFEDAAADGQFSKITVMSESGEAKGVLNAEGIKKQKIDTRYSDKSEVLLTTTIPPSGKIADKIDQWNVALKAENKPEIAVSYEKDSDLMKLFWYFGPFVLFILVMIFMSRRLNANGGPGGGIFNVGKSKAKVFDKSGGQSVTFKDVAGLAEAKVEIEEIVEFLKNPQRYTDLGAKIPRGALLVGPPGTGKTLLAKAVAGEANVPFLSMSGSDFVEMFVGVGAARVRDLFKQAKDKAPCIVFIDEIDAVGRARGKNPNMGGNDERENTLNQMLTEMDGFSSNNGVIILAATNRADMLDKALMRPGRFDRQIYVDLPELQDRVEIFNVHLRNLKVNSKLDVEQLARQTQGFSGADIANVCNEAALIAARNNKEAVDFSDFMAAIDRIVGGMEKRSRVITNDEKRSIATHEAGHATVSWLIQYGDPLVKVTIVPRGRALGAAWYAPEARQIVPTQALLDTICGLLGGRAAEELFLGEIGTGASNDLERATKIARAMVVMYGMSDKLPNVNYIDSTGQDYGFQKPYSEETAKLIDDEVTRIIAEQYNRAKEILKEYAKQHNEIRDLLILHEVIYHDDVEKILGKRPWKSRTDEIMELTAEDEKKRLESNSGTDHGDASENSKNNNEASVDDEDPGTPPPFSK